MNSANSPVPSIRSPLCLAAISALALIGCFVDVDLGESRLVCSDGRCPAGLECVADRCVPEGQGGAPDAAAPDPDAAAGTPDAPPPDGPPPDGPPPDAPPLLSCGDQYGGAPGFQLCAEEPGSCEFFLQVDPAEPCEQLCQEIGGGECVDAFNADPVDACARQNQTGCGGVNVSQICVCSRAPAP